MLPGAVAVAMVGFIGAFGSGTPAAYAIEGDICHVDSQYEHHFSDAFGNDVLVVEQGKTYGLVFRLEDAETHENIGEADQSIVDFDAGSENVEVRIDSETGSARITSKAEIVDVEETEDERSDGNEDEIYAANVDHVLITSGVGTQVVDTISPRYFNNPDGAYLDSINAWLASEGYAGFADDTIEVCGFGSNTSEGDTEYHDDYWGFIDFTCIEPGFFHIDILTPDDTEETGYTVKYLCPNVPDTAEISASPTTLETDPVGSSKDSSTITVTVEDTNGDRVEHALVTFSTDNCYFTGQESPAGGKPTVAETYTDTDSSSDLNYLANNPAQFSAGTAELTLNCSSGSLGAANVTAVVERPGSDIVLHTTVTVVGPTSATGLTLELTPEDFECGETLLATVNAVDADGQPVSDGTLIWFTTDTSSGVVGGSEGAQGGVATDDGAASVLIATDPGNPGIHTVIAYSTKGNATAEVVAQASATYTCDGAVAPAAPTVEAPATGTGTGSITPPNTGDAGLASGSTSASLFVIAGVAFVLAGLASIRFARN
jgi:hypothetical protein